MHRFFTRAAAFLLFAGCLPVLSSAAQSQPQSAAKPYSDFELHGVVRGHQNQSYIKVPFRVPPGTARVTFTFAYTARDQHTNLDMGLLDPNMLRCWSGGNKSMLTVGLSDATPSCLPGPIPSGTWNVLIGVPNIRAKVESHYTIHVYLSRSGAVAEEPPLLRQPLRSGPAWFRGDLHMHTGNSDGQCPNQTGTLVPCPVYFTVDAAARRGLDFIAITDHNATSQYDAMRALQFYYNKVLLIPGRELTTFQGHINFLGSTSFVDFRVGSKTVPTINDMLRNAKAAGGITSINHPLSPSGEICLGCGFTPRQPVDMHLLTGVEAVNGGSLREGENHVPYWDKVLSQGCRLTGIGGSDNHRPLQPLNQIGSVGSPTTVVYAENLSTPAILDGIRAGHVFLDVAGTHDRMLETIAKSGSQTAHAGDPLQAAAGANVSFSVHVAAASGGTLRWVEDGKPVSLSAGSSIGSADQSFPITWQADGKRHWFRAEVDGPDGKLWLLDNPIYINWNVDNHCPVNSR